MQLSAWPQYCMAGIIFANLFYHLVKDQNEKDMRDRIGAVLASFTVAGLYGGLLAAGGFWEPMFRYMLIRFEHTTPKG